MIKKFLLGLALLVSTPAWATWSIAHGTNGCATTASPCTLTVTSTTAGNLLVGIALFNNGSAQTLTTMTGGTSVHCTACTGFNSGASYSIDIDYVLSATGGTTSVVFTGTGTFEEVYFIEFHNTTGTSLYDVASNLAVTSATANMPGLSAGTLTGTNDLIIQGVYMGTLPGTTYPNSGTGTRSTLGSGFGAYSYLLNSTNNAAGVYSNTSTTAVLAAIAFKDANAVTEVPRRR